MVIPESSRKEHPQFHANTLCFLEHEQGTEHILTRIIGRRVNDSRVMSSEFELPIVANTNTIRGPKKYEDHLELIVFLFNGGE